MTEKYKGLLGTTPRHIHINYGSPGGIESWMLSLAKFYIFGVKYSERIGTEEDIEISVAHFKLVNSWNI